MNIYPPGSSRRSAHPSPLCCRVVLGCACSVLCVFMDDVPQIKGKPKKKTGKRKGEKERRDESRSIPVRARSCGVTWFERLSRGTVIVGFCRGCQRSNSSREFSVLDGRAVGPLMEFGVEM